MIPALRNDEPEQNDAPEASGHVPMAERVGRGRVVCAGWVRNIGLSSIRVAATSDEAPESAGPRRRDHRGAGERRHRRQADTALRVANERRGRACRKLEPSRDRAAGGIFGIE